MDPNKLIILLLNKIDLLPRDNLIKWLEYLRSELPTIAFRSSIQQSDICFGTKTLVRLIENYKNNSKIETNITVGIIGYPNVGKYSVIKSFLASKFQRSKEGIILAPDIVLMDKPGTIIASVQGENLEDAILRNATEMKYIPKPFMPIKTIVQRFPKEVLLQIYKVPYFEYYMMLIRRIAAEKIGKRKPTQNEELEIAHQIYEDWKTGKLPYHTLPPEDIPNDVSDKWRNVINQKQILQIENSQVFEKLATHYQKIMFSTPIKSLSVVIEPAWLKIDRTPDDKLTDINEEIPRRKQKKMQKK
jgi:nuclear GTP-binding protein